jgi:hypothetical protein
MAEREKGGLLAWANFWIAFLGVILGVPVVVFQLDEANHVQWTNSLYEHTNALIEIERGDPLARCLYPFLGVNNASDCDNRVFKSQESVTHALAFAGETYTVLEDIVSYQDAYCADSIMIWRRFLWCGDGRELYSFWIGEIHADPTGIFRFSISTSRDDMDAFVGATCPGTECTDKLIIFSQRELGEGVARVRAHLSEGLPPTDADRPQHPQIPPAHPSSGRPSQ